MRDAARRTVHAHSPVRIVALLDMHHAQQLFGLRPKLCVPGYQVAAAVDGVLEDVQPCTPAYAGA